MIDIETDERFASSEKTNIVTIGKWVYYQNTHIKSTPAWARYFGKKHLCTIYHIDGSYRLIIKKGNWLSEDCKVIADCFIYSFEVAQSLCKRYMD